MSIFSALIAASAAIILLLGWRYWFSVPLRSIVVAKVCYGAALGLLWIR